MGLGFLPVAELKPHSVPAVARPCFTAGNPPQVAMLTLIVELTSSSRMKKLPPLSQNETHIHPAHHRVVPGLPDGVLRRLGLQHVGWRGAASPLGDKYPRPHRWNNT